MTSQEELLEPSFAHAMASIETANDLSREIKRHWACSLRQIGKWLDRPLEMIPARWTAIRILVSQLHHARVGVTAKTLANHKSNVTAALRWFGNEYQVPNRGVPLSSEWARLRDSIADRGRRARLYGLMRYCSGKGIGPAAVTDATVAEFLRYRTATSALAAGIAAHRSIARSWNACGRDNSNWPQQRLEEPALKISEAPSWEDFPEGLHHDIETHLAGLGKMRRGPDGKRIRPCTARTIKTRRAELMAVARMAVRQGTPIETLTSLAALLDPDVVDRVIDGYWKRNGKEPKIFTIELGWKLLGLAREFDLAKATIDRLVEIRDTLEEYRRGGMTAKNLKLIRQVLSEDIWCEVVSLPQALMQRARADYAHAPVKAAVTAQIAVAIAILSVAPIRLANLVAINLDENLIRPAGSSKKYWLTFPHYDVKNRVDLEFPLDEILTKLIDEYVHDFRPILSRQTNAPWLFPGVAGKPKTANMFSTQITERIHKATGVRITVHQFRHAAAAVYLKHQPGGYETVRRLLGHRNIQTTINFYCGLETTQASETFGKLIRDQIKFDAA
ncbi:MAG: tyrosine-type recombinase/integrase [Xanthobacteraceae bacterium]